MSYRTLQYEVRDRVAHLTFATPESLNSITEERLGELAEVLPRAREDVAVRAMVVRGIGRAFCVGLDLELLKRAFADIAYWESVVRRLNDLIFQVEDMPFPVVAAVNGFARAGGFEIALACDLMLIADEAKLGDNHTQVGVMPGGGSTQRLPRRIGEQRAKELIYSGRWLQGPEAAQLGLALRSVPLAELDAAVETLVAPFRQRPREVIAAVKRAMHGGRTLPTRDGVELEIRTFLDYTGKLPIAAEGFHASLEGRPPAWL
jgi:enoyl-CoA hydratase/carnithine racemase